MDAIGRTVCLRSMLGLALCPIGFSALGAINVTTAQVTQCDVLAGSPSDPKKVAPGVDVAEIKASEAVAACNAAIARDGNNPRLWFELGRALAKVGAGADAAWRKAAEQGYAAAQYNLGIIFASGQGVPKDERQAADWFRLAAEQGIGPAQVNLGHLYEFGQGVPKDEQKAAAWYRMAAEQGDPVAEYNLGKMYANGRGVPKDDGEALAWFRKAAEQGQPDAKSAVAQIEQQKTSASVAAPPLRSDNGQPSAATQWIKLQADNGEVVQVLKTSITHFNNGTAEAVVYVAPPGAEYDPGRLSRLLFDCHGQYTDEDHGFGVTLDAPPNSVAGKIAEIACAGAVDLRPGAAGIDCKVVGGRVGEYDRRTGEELGTPFRSMEECERLVHGR